MSIVSGNVLTFYSTHPLDQPGVFFPRVRYLTPDEKRAGLWLRACRIAVKKGLPTPSWDVKGGMFIVCLCSMYLAPRTCLLTTAVTFIDSDITHRAIS